MTSTNTPGTAVVCFAAGIILSLLSTVLPASDLSQQVEYCKEELPATAMPGLGSCFTSTYPLSPDRQLGYFRVDDNVDAVFHCHNITKTMQERKIEMIVHNRGTGNTCFFIIRNPSSSGTFSSLNSCTNSSCSAASEWEVGATSGISPCTDCHKNGGPYFVLSEAAAKGMAHFGLLNNKHVTNFSEDSSGIFQPNLNQASRVYTPIHYDNAAEIRMNEDIHEAHPGSSQQNCAGSCHNFVRNDLSPFGMPPSDPHNPYRWINQDNQDATGDYERYSSLITKYKNAYATCSSPTYMQAHVVGSTQIINSNSEYAKLRAFNPRDGLVCKNADVANGDCPDYEVRFACQGLGWTNWQDNDNPSGTGDHEYRPEICINPTEIEARRKDGSLSFFTPIDSYGEGPWQISNVVRGFPDRLHRFDNGGLECVNDEQHDGQCANYVVRYVCAD